MERINKEVKRYETFYKAFDGTEFRSEEECKKHEQTYDCTLNKTFANMERYMLEPYQIGLPYDSEDYYSYILIPKSERDIVTLNEIKERICGVKDALTFNSIGKKTIVQFGYGADENSFVGADWVDFWDFEEFKMQIHNAWAKVEQNFETKTEE